MASRALVDTELLRAAEATFADTDEVVIAAFYVLKLKQPGEHTGAELLKALAGKSFLAREAPQPRLLVLTVRRNKTGRGFKPSLHTCRPPDNPSPKDPSQPDHHRNSSSPGSFLRRPFSSAAASSAAATSSMRSFPLKTLSEIAVPPSKYDHAASSSPVVHLHFTGPPSAGGGGGAGGLRGGGGGGAAGGGAGEVALQLKLSGADELHLILSLLLHLLRQLDYRLPHLSGVDAGGLQRWWLGHQAQVLPLLGAFAAEVLLPGGGSEGGAGDGAGGGARVLLSAKEERDLGDLFAGGIGDVAEFEARLAAEHEALEASNVWSIMASKPKADAVVFEIRKTQSLLEDLDENLLVFDTKLRHMREDIAAIEASNNSLELQSRNNSRLAHTLETLLSDLVLPADVEATLENPPFVKDSRLPAITLAAWRLHAKLRRLDPASTNCLSAYLMHLRVVKDARASLQDLARRFTAASLAHLRGVFTGATDAVLAVLAATTDKASRLSPPSHDQLRSALLRHAELVRATAALQPDVLPKLCGAYVASVNMLLRKELRVSAAELRKAAMQDMQANPIDYNLTSSANAWATPQGGRAGSVVGSRGPAPSIMGTSVVGSSEEQDEGRSEAGSLAGGGSLGHGGLGAGPGRGPASLSMGGSMMFAGGPLSSASRNTRSTMGRNDPTHVSLPLHEAWAVLLEGYLPHLLSEAEGAAACLLLRRGDLERAAMEAPLSDVPNPANADEGRGRKKKGRAGRRGGGSSQSDLQQLEGPGVGREAGGGGGAVALSAPGRQVVETLMAGADAEFMALVDLTSKSHQVLCLPMMALATRCINALAARGQVAAPLQVLLASCHSRLRANFKRFRDAQEEALEAYGARLGAAGSVKNLHVVAFVVQFAIMAHHVEVMLSQSADPLLIALSGGLPPPSDSGPAVAALAAAGGGGNSLSRPGAPLSHASGSSMAGGRGGAAGAGAGAGAARGGAGADGEEVEDESPEAVARRERVQQAAMWQVRPEVDGVYGSLVGLMFATLEKLAAADAKHGDRLRAENYGYFVEAVRPLLPYVASLEAYLLTAEARLEEALSRYVEAQLQYTALGRALSLSARIDELLAVVTPREVPFQAGCSAADVRALVATSMKDADKKIQKMYGRVKKHLRNSTLAFRVWERVYEQLTHRYGRLAEQLELCYPSLALSPTLEELQDVFRGVGPSASSP